MKTYSFIRNYRKNSIGLFDLYTLYKKKCFNDMLRITVILQEYDFPVKSTYNLAPSHLPIYLFFCITFWPIFTLNSKRAFQKLRLET